MAPPRKIVLEQAGTHESFHRAQFVILCLAVVSAAIYVIITTMDDQNSNNSDQTSTLFFRLLVSLGVLSLVMLLINYYRSSTKTLYTIKILAHLGALGLVVASSIELTKYIGEDSDGDDFRTSIQTFAGLTIGLAGLGTLVGIINASHEFAFLV